MKVNIPPSNLSSIDSIALSPISLSIFRLIGQKPQWLDMLGEYFENQQLIFNQPESFLDNFLVDARQFWLNSAQGSLNSGKWKQTDAKGDEYPFEATASFMRGKPVLLVQHVSERYLEIQRILQTARENAVSKEKMET